MRVLVVCHYYWPETGAPQARWREMTREWTSRGAEVTVLTGMPNHPTGQIPDEYQHAYRRRETDGLVKVIRTWLYATPNEGFVRKTLGHLSFMVSSVALGARAVREQDVVVVSSPTFFSIGSAWLLARMKRARFVVEVRDLWPAIFVDLGVLRNRTIISILERIELAAYRSADAVVVVSEGFRRNIASRGIREEKIFTIPNAADVEFFLPQEADQEMRCHLGASPEQSLVLYSGAHGISQGLECIVDVAEMVKDEPIHFAFVGDGADKQSVLDQVRNRGLQNVTLLPGVPREEMPRLISVADICLVPLRDIPLFASFIPSKIFEYLSMGKAVIGSVSGEAARILTEAGALVVGPEDAEQLARAIVKLARNPARRTRMGLRGREYVTTHFNRSTLARRYLEILTQLTDR